MSADGKQEVREASFLDDLLVEDAAVARDVTYRGKTGKVYFRRISAGERANLLKGQRIHAQAGQKTTVEIDLGESLHTKHLLVFYSVVHPDGKRYFKSVEDVKRQDGLKIERLYEHASEVNREEDEEDGPGKS